jgi:hypothetical protein
VDPIPDSLALYLRFDWAEAAAEISSIIKLMANNFFIFLGLIFLAMGVKTS